MAIRYLSGINVDQNTLFVDDVNNRVGIGTATPSSPGLGSSPAILNIYKSAGNAGVTLTIGGNAWDVANVGGNGLWFLYNNSTRVAITNSGNVGIGTTSPQVKLEVRGAQNNTIAPANAVAKFVGGDAGIFVGNLAGTPNYGAWLQAMRESDGLVFPLHLQPNGGNVGIGTTSPVSIGSGVTTLDIQGSSAGGVAFGPSGIKNYIYGASTMYIEAHTTAVFTTSGTEKMRLTTGGQFIVGGSTVGYSGTKLQVGNTSDSQNGLNILTSTTGYGYILFGDGGGADTYVGQIWYYHGDNYMGFQTNGSEKLRITSNGNVGIGTTAPQYKLDVAQVIRSNYGSNEGGIYLGGTPAGVAYTAGAVRANPSPSYSYTGKLSFYTTTWGAGSDYGITEQMYIETSVPDTKAATAVMLPWGGNVGIGTTSPAYKLQVAGGDIAIDYNRYLRGGGGGDWNLVNLYNGGTGDLEITMLNANWYLRHNANATFAGNVGIGATAPGAKLEVDSGSTLPIIRARYNATYYTDYDSNGIQFVGTGQNFNITDNGSSVLYLKSGGNVGIGTTSPAYKLDVAGDIRTSGTGGLYIDASTNFGDNSGGGLSILNLGSTRALRIVATTGSGWGNIILNPYGGNVGIGTTAPNQKLQVNGFVNATGYVNSGTTFIKSFNIGNISAGATFALGRLNFESVYTHRFRVTIASYYGSKTFDFIGYQYYLNKIVSGISGGGDVVIETILDVYNQVTGVKIGITTGVADYVYTANVECLSTFLSWEDYSSTTTITPTSIGYTNSLFAIGGGNVGIGTTSPAKVLHVQPPSTTDDGIRLTNSAGGNLINLYQENGTEAFIRMYSNNVEKIQFRANGNSYINSGNVGIGTTAPTDPLTIGGGQTGLSINSATTGDPYVRWRLDGTIYTDAYVDRGTGNFIVGPSVSAALIIKTNATEKMRITSAGNVGIGTTSPTVAKLQIANPDAGSDGSQFQRWVYTAGTAGVYELHLKQTVTAGVVRYNFSMVNASTAYNDVLVLDRGKVGIGTTNPVSKFHTVLSNGQGTPSNYAGNVATFQTNNSTGFDAYISIIGGDTGRSGVLFGDKDAMNRGIISYVHTNDRLEFGAAGNFASMVIDSTGNVGIGTTSPSAKLTVIATSTYAGIFSSSSGEGTIEVQGAASSNARIRLLSNAGATVPSASLTASDHKQIIHKTNNDFAVQQYDTSNGWQDLLTIKSSGNVGIGTTAPGDKLEIAGGTVVIPNGQFYRGRYNGGTPQNLIGMSTGNVIQVGDFSSSWNLQLGGTSAIQFMLQGTERMRITAAGNVGIGTTSPTSVLDIRRDGGGSTNPIPLTSWYGGNGGGNLVAKLEYTADAGIFSIGYAGISSWDSIVLDGGTSNSGSSIALKNDATTTVFLRSSSGNNYINSGNVGIGTTSPTELLHVAGTPRIDSEDLPPAVITAQVTQDKYVGLNSAVLTDPSTWMKVNINGAIYLIPAYLYEPIWSQSEENWSVSEDVWNL